MPSTTHPNWPWTQLTPTKHDGTQVKLQQIRPHFYKSTFPLFLEFLKSKILQNTPHSTLMFLYFIHPFLLVFSRTLSIYFKFSPFPPSTFHSNSLTFSLYSFHFPLEFSQTLSLSLWNRYKFILTSYSKPIIEFHHTQSKLNNSQTLLPNQKKPKEPNFFFFLCIWILSL